MRVIAIAGILLATLGTAQERFAARSPRDLFEMTDSETRGYVEMLVAAGLPEESTDQLILLAMNRSRVVVPALVAGILSADSRSQSDQRLTHKMLDLVAYAADEQALDALSQLCESDDVRFGYFIKRSLTYAGGRRNALSLAYRALSTLSARNHYLVAEWATDALEGQHSNEQWSRELLSRYKGHPSEDDLASDPIARLIGGIPKRVRLRLDKLP